MRSLILIILLVSFKGFAEDRNFFALPGAVSLHGVGLIYGLGAGVSHVFDGQTSLMVVKTAGAVDASGLLVTDVPVGGQRLKLSFGYAAVERAEFETSYVRGFAKQGLRVKQMLKGMGSLLGLRYEIYKDRLYISTSHADSIVRFIDYKTLGGKLIPFSKDSLHDINTQINSVSLLGYIIPPSKSRIDRLSLGLSVTSMLGRIAQSDTENININLKGTHRLTPRWSIAYTVQVQKTIVTKSFGSGAVNGDCNGITNAEIKNQCKQLESEVSSYITESNKYGTGAPLGGSRGLRSFRELRFKAAHTALHGVEMAWDVKTSFPLQFIGFVEYGHASDNFAELYAESRSSVGIGARAFVKKIPIRLEVANGNEGTAGFLTAGLPW